MKKTVLMGTVFFYVSNAFLNFLKTMRVIFYALGFAVFKIGFKGFGASVASTLSVDDVDEPSRFAISIG